MKQKVVLKVSMNDQKSRRKALKTVVGQSGVDSTALKGQEKNQIEVIGDGIDAVKLTTSLRKNIGYAELVSVSPVGDKKDGDKEKNSTPPRVSWSNHPYVYSGVPYHLYEVRDPNCTIL